MKNQAYTHKIAYMITAYTEPLSLKNLVTSLDNNDVDFYIHIDRKFSMDEFKDVVCESQNVCFLNDDERVKVYWGGYTQILMQYNLIKKIIESGHEYKRVVNLTGMDYPVVSNARLMEYWLDESVEYIWGYNLADDSTGNQMRKVSCFHYMDSPKIIWKAIGLLGLNNTRYQKKYGYNYYFGSEYWALSLDVLKKTLAEWDSNKDLQNILRRSFAPSEIWIHTLFFNSTFRNKGKLVEGEYKGLKSVSPLMYFDYKDKIQVLNEDYYEQIIDSGKLFARKFVIGKSDKLKQMIDYRRMQT